MRFLVFAFAVYLVFNGRRRRAGKREHFRARATLFAYQCLDFFFFFLSSSSFVSHHCKRIGLKRGATCNPNGIENSATSFCFTLVDVGRLDLSWTDQMRCCDQDDHHDSEVVSIRRNYKRNSTTATKSESNRTMSPWPKSKRNPPPPQKKRK